MNGTLRVGTLFGIPFYIHPSWFFVLVLATLSNSSSLGYQFRELGDTLPILLGFITALLLFGSVLLHELGHSFVAIQRGIPVDSITLFLFGGVASLEKEAQTPGEAFQVAIAGPLVSLVLFGILTTAGEVVTLPDPAASILETVATINLILATFNLIPGLPLDGGNILKAAVWKMTANPFRGTVIAGRAGQVFGWVAIVAGVIPMLVLGTFSTIWTVLIGWFLVRNAGLAAREAQLQNRLSQLTAADAVLPDSPIVRDDLTLREFVNQHVIGQSDWRQFFVVDEAGKWVGLLLVDDLKLIETDQWPHVLVQDLMRAHDSTAVVTPDVSLLDVVKRLEQDKITELTVVDSNNTLMGLLEKASIRQILGQSGQTKAVST